MMHDRAVDYPVYPHVTTVANPQQLSGVITGRLVAAQRQCSRVDLFKDAVAGILTHAHRRGYSRRMLHSTWTRFLVRYWDAAGVTTKELRQWFHVAWRKILREEPGRERTTANTNRSHDQGMEEIERSRTASTPDHKPAGRVAHVPDTSNTADRKAPDGRHCHLKQHPHTAKTEQPAKQPGERGAGDAIPTGAE